MKARFFNAYTAFALGAVLFGAITFIQLPCPVCHGTGVVEGVQGLEITGVDATLVEHRALGMQCGWDYERYKYDIKVTVKNLSTAEAWGVIMIDISDPEASITLTQEIEDEEVQVEYSGKSMQSTPIFVDIAASGSKVIEETLLYEGLTLEAWGEKTHRIDASTASEFPCPFHGENARVSLTEWLRLR